MAQSNWQLKDHDDLERPYWEITNGPISLCVNDDDIEEEHITAMKEIVSALNSGGIQFHSENALELKQHIEIMELKEQAQRMADALERVKSRLNCIDNANEIVIIQEAIQQFKDRGKEVVINEDQAYFLLNPPDDNSPKGMPLPAEDPLKK